MLFTLKQAILWLGFFITSGFKLNAYSRWKKIKELDSLQMFPPTYDEWFSPFLGLYIDLKLWRKTGHKVSWFNENFERLNYEENLWEFTKITGVGWVRITGDMIHVRELIMENNRWGWRYEFTINANSNGSLYIQERKGPKYDWTIAYREGIEIQSLTWLAAFEELVRQLDEGEINGNHKNTSEKPTTEKP